MKQYPFILLLAAAALSHADDRVHLKDGTVREGRLVGVEEQVFRLSLSGPASGRTTATTAIARESVEKIVFAPDAALDAIKANRTVGATAAARVRWQTLRPLLGVPESRAAEAGHLYAEILLLAADRPRHEEALAVCREVEEGAWSPADREAARRGRLRAMIKLGRIDEIAAEVEEIAATAQDPELLLDAKLLLAQTRLAALRGLLADNPRWHEDPPVRAERLRLIHETADHALYPFLFHGTAREQAARGLGIAFDLYLLTGDDAAARDVATDLAHLYPGTPEAARTAEAVRVKTDQS